MLALRGAEQPQTTRHSEGAATAKRRTLPREADLGVATSPVSDCDTEAGGGSTRRTISWTPLLPPSGTRKDMRGLLALCSVVLATVCFVLVNGEEIEVLQNEVYHKEGSEDLVIAQLLPARETLVHEGERDGGITSSGDNFSDLPRVAFLSKPQDPVTPKKKGKGQKRRKGKGRKRDPCLRKFKDYCIHGECSYVKQLKRPSCKCLRGYYGERCHVLSLPVETPPRSYDHTTILAATAVVLSSLCLIIIAALLMLRCHKQGVYDVENEEKVKLGITVNH